jgi:histidinol-phosphate/aromatic aminotransferase/cobyric acid decarboxylase-like protein
VRPEPRPELVALPAVVHGGSQDARLLDFSTGVSPLPPPEEILTAVRGADLSRYPHPTALPVRDAIGGLHDLPPDRIVVGAGSVELIWAVARGFAGPGRKGLVVTPAFGEYEQSLRASGAGVVIVTMSGPRFDFPLDAIQASLASEPIALVFLCRPSNPCLTSAAAEDVAALARHSPNTLFIVDEAYLPLFEDIPGVPVGPNVAVLRSMTKVFALPGVRLGYLLAAPPIAAAVQRALPPWNVSSPAQAAGIAAASLLPLHAASVKARIAVLRTSLSEALARVVGSPAGAGGPFLLYEVAAAAALVRDLLDRGIAIRHAASFGLPEHVRIGVRDEQTNRELVARWAAARYRG